ncbi:MFS transporter [Pseudomonas sp. CBSPBW29]|uniref:MFS transporter n=1 Tax=Pseudomonas TaxID=286 RepID=UPI0021ACF831|nr:MULTISPECIES: MFS transporter [unclassified Pseudomonas]WEL42061.1 MFS transporter [Pseudomonas sp. CBSPBW29]WEL63124.1 MFS transporter [Pseudomonas sp. CBSPGW29]WEL72311.1 MFS transporter [Pseudomonas sp. CBSPCGW29]WEL79209.1 MFS transporter [Pseudomonas sp. CBSPAW29]WEL90612.1 MFS transporter [Pseudomonas sp. CBSPCBW29]
MHASPAVGGKLFALFCLASYLLSLSYGSTFLLSLLIHSRGGNEHDAGSVISMAMLSTFVAVLVSGHLADLLGAARSIALLGLLLMVACLGFALTPGFGEGFMLFGLSLGLGWGVFYTLGPIIVAMLVEPAQRAKYFALLSGSMMTGIGSGPLLGRAASALDFSLTAAFFIAALASLAGVLIFWRLGRALSQHTAPVSKISWSATRQVLSSKAVFAIIMVGLGGCVFGGLSSFQTSYAALHGLDYSLFFLGFMSAAITSRLLIAGIVVKRDPYWAACVLSGLTLVSIFLFGFRVSGNYSYLLAAVTLGIGYGLTYSVINGLAANEAPAGTTSQALLLFSLAYFIGVFGFPLLAGKVIVEYGMPTLLMSVLAVALLNWLITVARLIWRRISSHKILQAT